jgi:hypothetical protein
MTEITISRRSAEKSLEAAVKHGAPVAVQTAWKSLVDFFAAEPAAVSINGEWGIWAPIIEATGEAIAASSAR